MAIDATIGGATSDSYSTVADADAYHTNHLYHATWTAASTDSKERSLKMATRLLDERITWVGSKYTDEQHLRWPRGSVTDLDGDSVLTFSKTDTADVLPTIVQEMLRGWGTIHARAKFGSVTVVRT